MKDEVYNIRFHHPEHGTHTVLLKVRRLNHKFLLSCRLPVSDELISAKASDCFAALQRIEEQLKHSDGRSIVSVLAETFGRQVLCNIGSGLRSLCDDNRTAYIEDCSYF